MTPSLWTLPLIILLVTNPQLTHEEETTEIPQTTEKPTEKPTEKVIEGSAEPEGRIDSSAAASMGLGAEGAWQSNSKESGSFGKFDSSKQEQGVFKSQVAAPAMSFTLPAEEPPLALPTLPPPIITPDDVDVNMEMQQGPSSMDMNMNMNRRKLVEPPLFDRSMHSFDQPYPQEFPSMILPPHPLPNTGWSLLFCDCMTALITDPSPTSGVQSAVRWLSSKVGSIPIIGPIMCPIVKWPVRLALTGYKFAECMFTCYTWRLFKIHLKIAALIPYTTPNRFYHAIIRDMIDLIQFAKKTCSFFSPGSENPYGGHLGGPPQGPGPFGPYAGGYGGGNFDGAQTGSFGENGVDLSYGGGMGPQDDLNQNMGGEMIPYGNQDGMDTSMGDGMENGMGGGMENGIGGGMGYADGGIGGGNSGGIADSILGGIGGGMGGGFGDGKGGEMGGGISGGIADGIFGGIGGGMGGGKGGGIGAGMKQGMGGGLGHGMGGSLGGGMGGSLGGGMGGGLGGGMSGGLGFGMGGGGMGGGDMGGGMEHGMDQNVGGNFGQGNGMGNGMGGGFANGGTMFHDRGNFNEDIGDAGSNFDNGMGEGMYQKINGPLVHGLLGLGGNMYQNLDNKQIQVIGDQPKGDFIAWLGNGSPYKTTMTNINL